MVVLKDRYKIIKSIGKGNYSNVYQALDSKQLKEDKKLTYVAVKILSDTEQTKKELNKIEKEKEICSLLKQHGKHPGLCDMLDFFIIDDRKYFVFEYFDGITLEDFVRQKYSLDRDYQALHCPSSYFNIMKQIAEVLEYIHSKEIVHRDIKTTNIMINRRGKIKLIDFGLSDNLDGYVPITKSKGTPLYMCHETLNGKINFYNYLRQDVYATGILFYFLLNHKMPYNASSFSIFLKVIKEQNAKSDYPLSCKKANCDWFNTIVHNSMEKHYRLRLNSKQLLFAFNDTFTFNASINGRYIHTFTIPSAIRFLLLLGYNNIVGLDSDSLVEIFSKRLVYHLETSQERVAVDLEYYFNFYNTFAVMFYNPGFDNMNYLQIVISMINYCYYKRNKLVEKITTYIAGNVTSINEQNAERWLIFLESVYKIDPLTSDLPRILTLDDFNYILTVLLNINNKKDNKKKDNIKRLYESVKFRTMLMDDNADFGKNK